MTSLSFYKVDDKQMVFNDMFNEEHSALVIKEIYASNPSGKTMKLKNCGVRIMKDIFESLHESGISSVDVHYDWDTIMLRPNLVSWDKLSWKNIQQINNWNKVWRYLFTPLRDCTSVKLYLRCSWMNEDFLKSVLQSLISMPFLSNLHLQVEARDKSLHNLLEQYKKAKFFKNFEFKFQNWGPKAPF